MPHAMMSVVPDRFEHTLSATDVVVSPVPYIVGPASPRRPRRRPSGRPIRRQATSGKPPSRRPVLRVIVALSVVAMVVGTLPLAWRAPSLLNERRASAIMRATIDGFGGAIGGSVLTPVLSGRR